MLSEFQRRILGNLLSPQISTLIHGRRTYVNGMNRKAFVATGRDTQAARS
jgi:hypothetical protein